MLFPFSPNANVAKLISLQLSIKQIHSKRKILGKGTSLWRQSVLMEAEVVTLARTFVAHGLWKAGIKIRVGSISGWDHRRKRMVIKLEDLLGRSAPYTAACGRDLSSAVTSRKTGVGWNVRSSKSPSRVSSWVLFQACFWVHCKPEWCICCALHSPVGCNRWCLCTHKADRTSAIMNTIMII